MRTEESWSGDVVVTNQHQLQQALDASLASGLQQLKKEVERGQSPPEEQQSFE